jgi:hypothetical protein
VEEKRCVLDESKLCDGCGECDRCDLDPEKICDNCMKCVLSGADYMSVFTKPQLDALALGSLRFRSGGAAVPMGFWGLWLFPFGILVMKSGFFPRILGILLLVAGFAYVVGSATSIVMPAHRQVVSRVLMPLYFGEVPIIFWLFLEGAKVPQANGTETTRIE